MKWLFMYMCLFACIKDMADVGLAVCAFVFIKYVWIYVFVHGKAVPEMNFLALRSVILRIGAHTFTITVVFHCSKKHICTENTVKTIIRILCFSIESYWVMRTKKSFVHT